MSQPRGAPQSRNLPVLKLLSPQPCSTGPDGPLQASGFSFGLLCRCLLPTSNSAMQGLHTQGLVFNIFGGGRLCQSECTTVC